MTITFTGALALLFLALKLTGSIDWSWWLVLLPLYWLPALLVILFVAKLYCGFVVDLCTRLERRRKKTL